jgi:hypothetical protein
MSIVLDELGLPRSGGGPHGSGQCRSAPTCACSFTRSSIKCSMSSGVPGWVRLSSTRTCRDPNAAEAPE